MVLSDALATTTPKRKLHALKNATFLAFYPVDAYVNMVHQAISLLGSETPPHEFRNMFLKMEFNKIFDLGVSVVVDDMNQNIPTIRVRV